jgi:hypothetical protein
MRAQNRRFASPVTAASKSRDFGKSGMYSHSDLFHIVQQHTVPKSRSNRRSGMSNGTQLGIIDTSHFNVAGSCEIGVGHALRIEAGYTDHGTGVKTGDTVLFQNSGGAQRGSLAFYNAPDNSYSFTLGLSKFGLEAGYQGDPPTYATVTFSAARVAHGDNYRLADAAALKLAFSKVEKGLREAGIKVDLAQALLTRVDVTKNVLTEENPKDYFPMLRTLPCKLKESGKFAGSLSWGNGSQAVSIYSKRDEMIAKERSVVGIPETIRFEQKFKNREKVKAYLGFDTGLDLLNNLDHAAKRYKEAMEKNIFKLDVFDFEVDTTQQYVDELNALKPFHPYVVPAYLMRRGYQGINEEAFLLAIEEVCGNRTAVFRAKKKLHELKMETMSLELPVKNRKTSGQLYKELKNKVLS